VPHLFPTSSPSEPQKPVNWDERLVLSDHALALLDMIEWMCDFSLKLDAELKARPVNWDERVVDEPIEFHWPVRPHHNAVFLPPQ
jgi:hypothetical protein